MMGIGVNSEVPLTVTYKGQAVGEFRADIVVENKVLIELKAVKTLHPAAEAQVINYLKATGFRVGLLVNFAKPKATIKRLVFLNGLFYWQMIRATENTEPHGK
jgi:GxxExxY protein